MSMRHSGWSSPGDAGRTAFAEDVANALTQNPRQLPCRYLYDELGSSLFEAICRLPWYRVTRTEQSLLRTHAGAIFSRLPPISTVVELGPGSGEKLETLMAACPRRDVTVHLVDVSPAALASAARMPRRRASVPGGSKLPMFDPRKTTRVRPAAPLGRPTANSPAS